MPFLLWVVLSLIAGGIASGVVPGRPPGGTIGALVVGLLGGLLGGWLLELLGVDRTLSWIGSFVVAVVGAVIILSALRAFAERRRS